MSIQIDGAFFIHILLASIRVGAVLVLTPLFAVGGVPARVRVFLGMGLATLLVAANPATATPTASIQDVGALANAAAFEFVTGGVLAFGVSAAFAAFVFGGRILDFQLGFGVASMIDPSTRTQAPLLGTLLGMMAVTTFFLVDGHHLLVRGLSYSFDRVAIGTPLTDVDAVGAMLVDAFGAMFAFGLAVVAPCVLTLLLVDVGMAVAARTMPQVNMFILSIPIKVLVGLSVLAMSLSLSGPLLERIYTSIFASWETVLR